MGRETYFAGNFGGTAGTLASLFDKGIAVRNDFCKNLGLAIPTITWQVSRDRLANFSSDMLQARLARWLMKLSTCKEPKSRKSKKDSKWAKWLEYDATEAESNDL